MAKLVNLYLDGKFPVSTNRLNHFDRLFGQALFGGVEKSVDYAPIISISDALNKPALEVLCKITAIQEGSGDPSPINIRPFIGFSGLSLFRTGKNIAYKKINGGMGTDGTIITNSTTSIVIAKVKKSVSYAISASGDWDDFYYAFFESEPRLGSESYDNKRYSGTNFTAPIDGYVGFRIRRSWEEYQCEVGTTVTAYKPYETPTEYAISWQTEAGTVYGVILNFTTGLLTVTHIKVSVTDFVGSGIFARSYTNLAGKSFGVTDVNIMPLNITDVKCNMYGFVSYNNRHSGTLTTAIQGYSINGAIVIPFDTITELSDMKQWLSELENTIDFVYPLATPLTYQLSPSEVVLLAGNNTLWNTTGDTALTYMAKR